MSPSPRWALGFYLATLAATAMAQEHIADKAPESGNWEHIADKAPDMPCKFPEWGQLGCAIFAQTNSTCGGTTLPLVSHVCDESSGCQVAVAYELAGHTCEQYCKHAGLVCVSAHVVQKGQSGEEACAEASEKRASWETCDTPFPKSGKPADPKMICDCGGFSMESHPQTINYDALQAKSCLGVFDRYLECSTKHYGAPDQETMYIREKLLKAARMLEPQKCIFIDTQVFDQLNGRKCTKEYLDLVQEQKVERAAAWRR